jgi:hypothetical protein
MEQAVGTGSPPSILKKKGSLHVVIEYEDFLKED